MSRDAKGSSDIISQFTVGSKNFSNKQINFYQVLYLTDRTPKFAKLPVRQNLLQKKSDVPKREHWEKAG